MHADTFEQYWAAYRAGHARPATRLLHYLGLFFVPLAGLAGSVLVAWWIFFVVAPPFYIAARLAHPLLEGNSNEAFAVRPLWSAMAFLRMLGLDICGRLASAEGRPATGR